MNKIDRIDRIDRSLRAKLSQMDEDDTIDVIVAYDKFFDTLVKIYLEDKEISILGSLESARLILINVTARKAQVYDLAMRDYINTIAEKKCLFGKN